MIDKNSAEPSAWMVTSKKSSFLGLHKDEMSASDRLAQSCAPKDAEMTALYSQETIDAAVEETQRPLLDLLARIHGDGGDYVDKHGVLKSLEDAHSMIADWRLDPDAQRKDAERYRFLRAADHIPISPEAARDAVAYDAAIDAAMDSR